MDFFDELHAITEPYCPTHVPYDRIAAIVAAIDEIVFL